MARIKLYLKNLTFTEKVAKGRQIVAAMTNNNNFPNASPPLTDNAATKVDQILTQLGGYVESVAGKDDTLITSAGMDTKAARSASSLPNVPQALKATASSWTHVGIATPTSKTIASLTSGKRCWFRLAAIGAGGQSGWSEHATKVAP